MASHNPYFPVNIPQYLTEGEEKLKEELENFAVNAHLGQYYGIPSHEEDGEALYQGDGIIGISLFDYNANSTKKIKAVILSNTCDISLENQRDLPPYVTVAPLIDLLAYKELLLASGLKKVSVDGKISAFRNQEVSNMFYLPAGSDGREYVAVLERAQSLPLSHVVDSYDRIFSLSLYGFYLLLFKLSIHFCRFQEGLSRPSVPEVT